jgi:hypothetical protein
MRGAESNQGVNVLFLAVLQILGEKFGVFLDNQCNNPIYVETCYNSHQFFLLKCNEFIIIIRPQLKNTK